MSICKGLHRAACLRKSAAPSAGPPLLTLDNPAGWLTGASDVAMSTDKAMKISTVNRCVEVLSNSMAVLPVYVMDEATKARLPDHPLHRILWEQANEAMVPFDLHRLLLAQELMDGNAYAWINRDRSTGRPVERIPLRPELVSQVWDRDGKRWYQYLDPISGDAILIRPEDITHYKAHSMDGLNGTSVLKRASLTMATAMAAQKYERATWESGGQPSGVLQTEADLGPRAERQPDGSFVTVDPKARIRDSWERIHRGPDNAFRLAVLDLGLKYQPISMSNSDAQFVESNEIRVADICRFFGVPLHLAYAGKQSYESNEQNGIEFVNYTLLAYETQWHQEDTRRLLNLSERQKQQRIKRELKVFLRGDTAAQAAWYQAMKQVGALSPNDIRGLEDLGRVDGGDDYAASLNDIPLRLWAELSQLRAEGKAGNEHE